MCNIIEESPKQLKRRKFPTFIGRTEKDTRMGLKLYLKPLQYEVFCDYYDNGLSVEELSQKYNMDVQRIKTFIMTLRKRILKHDPQKPINPSIDPITGQFKKGMTPWNKGKYGYMGANKTSFTRDTIKQAEIGSPKQGNGHLVTATDERKAVVDKRSGKTYMHHKRESYPRWLMKQQGIDVPAGSVVWHKDGDYRNNELDNLEVITRAEAIRRTLHNKNKVDESINEVLRLAGVEPLNEAVGGNYLYHGTKLDVLFQILTDNMLEGSQSDYDNRAIYGVSTSRDMDFAYNFAEMSNHLDGTNEDESYQAVIVLDKTKLKQNYKIIPYNDQNAHNVYDNGERYFGIIAELLEKEEVVVGDIKNIKDYIIDIYVSPECKEFNTPEKLFTYYYKCWPRNSQSTIDPNKLKYYISNTKNTIDKILNAKVYTIGRSQLDLRNNI